MEDLPKVWSEEKNKVDTKDDQGGDDDGRPRLDDTAF